MTHKHIYMYVCMYVCVKTERQEEENAKGLPDTRDFQRNPCYRSLLRIHQEGAKIYNKTYSFEVSIGVLPLISIVSSKASLLQKSHENPSTRSQDISSNM